jgi:surface carbohydrate biosynthesis protein (TIGR04326 family)
LNLSGIAEKRKLVSAKRFKVKRLVSESPKVSILILGDMNPVSMHHFLRLTENTMKLLPLGYKFTFKSHPGFAVNLANYPGLRSNETMEALDRILADYDLVLAANSTSASIDAYLAGLPVIIGLDGASFNLNPMRGQPGVRFVSSPEELAEALQKVDQDMVVDSEHNEFFFLDAELPRWKQLLEFDLVGNS